MRASGDYVTKARQVLSMLPTVADLVLAGTVSRSPKIASPAAFRVFAGHRSNSATRQHDHRTLCEDEPFGSDANRAQPSLDSPLRAGA